jgi:dTDP-4-amino-4,6-dideoxygalactose transaminase
MPELDWYRSWSDVQPEDLEKLARALSGGALSVVSGGLLERFERRFAGFAGASHAVAFHNGTGSLHAALRACLVGPGDDVLMCDYGFHGMAAAVLACGARIVPVDCSPQSLCMDPADLARARTPRSKAVLLHNPWGMPADLKALRQAAGGLPLICDASHAHGASYHDSPLGGWADVTCYSLGHQKLISGGELGCAVTSELELRDRMLIEGHVNRVPKDLKSGLWSGNAVGLKMRPHPAAMVLAQAQMGRFADKLARLRRTCARVEALLAPLGLRGQSAEYRHDRVWWRIVLLPDESLSEQSLGQLRQALKAARIPVEENHYLPVLQHQEIFAWPRHQGLILRRDCPCASRLAPRLITLPAPVELPETAWQELSSVVATVEEEPGRGRTKAYRLHSS